MEASKKGARPGLSPQVNLFTANERKYSLFTT